ncbi:Holliday junction branch migration protein RuvA [Oscillatoria sp. CS-180]|uniref:Holliday junction branch migration protein RuvA n=1 Tax=Oscillatoria sp. CS-180 TaxID=3021720 RepID=UPI0023307212|nr:Holliday junction branch migration protein RuvA [Oscillatoria sp. CS-180]MDB9526841.1 Holliday junction branch migration protein RuvA [Oscillatoria sp. CS-180]
MLSYLKGTLADITKPGGQRVIITIDVNQVGYDLQVTSRFLGDLPPLGEPIQVFCHLQIRDDQPIVFGFANRSERDVFRQLVSVSGIGPQMAMALLDTLGFQELIQAVVSGNTRLISQTKGVGSKTAERLILELKTKLAEWRQQSGLAIAPNAGPMASVQEDVEITLLTLGYTNGEIMKAFRAIGRNSTLAKNDNAEDWIREAIAWLSQST